MLAKFRKTIAENLPFLMHSKLLLATSGGLDSMVMTALFKKEEFDIALAHCNFNLRASESDADENFIRKYADGNNIPIFTANFDTVSFASDNKTSIQVAARQLRYLWFEELSKEHGFDYVLTAHHADDNLETFLINLSRGTGLDGLTGIPIQNGNIVRPLLAFTREEIAAFAQENKIEWREDSSNASDKYLRNKLRRDIVPILKELNPRFLESFGETLQYLKQASTMVEDAAKLVYKEVVIEKEDKIIFKIFDLKRLPNFRAYLHHWLRDFGFTAWQDIYDLVDAQTGKQIFSPEYVLLKDREILVLQKRQESNFETFTIATDLESLKFPINLLFTKVSNIGEATVNRIFVDYDKLKYPLQLRKWREGDSFQPFGMIGSKNVSKFFKDEKFSLYDKAEVWILISGDEQIIWIVGNRMDDRFKITSETTNILEIELL